MRKEHDRINPAKLLHSKWTAVAPQSGKKHFMVVEVEYDEKARCCLACWRQCSPRVSTRLTGVELKNTERWRQGWK
ncbi:TIGR02450 family Trp-rich protein [Halopseudomonas pachastrellae]|nr:TIGR02450 family Trp-rich protein [Halopseudomonas pachastrellae]